jgi:hypothetical protein
LGDLLHGGWRHFFSDLCELALDTAV